MTVPRPIKTLSILLSFLLIIFLVVYTDAQKFTAQKKAKPCKVTFEDGDGPYYLPNAPFRDNLRAPGTQGTLLDVFGTVLQNDCTTPVANAVIDIWQADDRGVYVNEWYRGQIRSDAHGYYAFQTVIPKGYGEGTAYRPPHIHYKVRVDNKLIITSEMFFPDVKGKEGFDDAYIVTLKKSLLGNKQIAHHNIILPSF